MHSHKEKTLIRRLVVDKHTYLTPHGGNVQLSGVSEVAQTRSGLPRGCGQGQQRTEQKPGLQAWLQPSHHGPIRKLITVVRGCVSPEALTYSATAPHTYSHSSASARGPQAGDGRAMEPQGNLRPPSRFKVLSVHSRSGYRKDRASLPLQFYFQNLESSHHYKIPWQDQDPAKL